MDRRELLTRLVGATFFAGTSTMVGERAEAGAHQKRAPITYPPSDPTLFAEIDAVLARTEAIWTAQEWWRLPEEIWDRDDPTPIYVAEEVLEDVLGE